jgi:hypothetical protein
MCSSIIYSVKSYKNNDFKATNEPFRKIIQPFIFSNISKTFRSLVDLPQINK